MRNVRYEDRAPFHQYNVEGRSRSALPAFHHDNIIDPDLAPFMSDEGSSEEEQASIFVEVMLTTIFVQLRKKKHEGFEKAIKDSFLKTAGVSGLPQGLMMFLDNVMSATELATGKEKKAVEKGRVVAIEALSEAARAAPDVDGGEDTD